MKHSQAEQAIKESYKEIKDDLIRDEVDDTREDYFKGSKEDIDEI